MDELDWRTLPSLTALRAFEATARLNSFSAAARALNVTHAAVSQQVRALEAEMGMALVYRDGRGMALTSEGERLARGLGEGFRTLRDSIEGLRRDHAAQPLKISLTPAFATQWLMPRLGDFWQAHPDIAISLHPDRRIVDIERDGFDLAIRFGGGTWPGVQATLLASAGYLITASPALLNGRTELTIPEMQDMPWVIEAHWPEPTAWLRSLGLETDKLSYVEIPTEELAIAAARQGYGLYAEVEALAAEDVRKGNLVALHRACEAEAAYYILTRRGEQDARIRTFITWLRSAV